MTSPEDATLAYWQEHREQFRQSENQRAVLTNYILVIAAAISGLIVQQHFSGQDAATVGPDSCDRPVRGTGRGEIPRAADYHLYQARALTRAFVDSGSLPPGQCPG